MDLEPTTGVQRIDDFTDEHGERTLRRVAAGHVTLRARWGSRSGEAVVDVRDGVTMSATVVVK